MANFSAWTETGNSINLVPVTTTVGSSVENVNYLNYGDQITLMAEYTAELSIKTSLDTLAANLSISSSSYDSAVAAISSGLIADGAPSDWATTWPVTTTFGPVTGIQTSLANWWSEVATQRTALQASISAAQAAAAQAAAVATAANNAATQVNNALATAEAAAATAQSNAIAAADTAAANAQAAAIQTAAAMGASQSIIPNGGFSTGDATGWGWGDVAGAGGTGTGTYGTLPDGAGGLTLPAGGNYSSSTPAFQVTPGQTYQCIYWVYAGSGSQSVYLRVNYGTYAAPNITSVNRASSYDFVAGGSLSTSLTYYTYGWTVPAGINYASLCVYEWSNATAPVYVQGLYCVPYVEAANILAGAVTANALAADSVTANSIAAGAVTATALAAGSVTTNALAAGSVTTSILAADAVTANNIEAGAILASKLTITDTTNLCGNPSGATGADNWSGPVSVYANGNYGLPAGAYCLMTSSRDNYYGGLFPVNPGEVYYFSVQCCPGGYYSGLGTTPAAGFTAGLLLCPYPTGTAGGGETWQAITYGSPSQSGWATISGQITVPAGFYYANIWVQINDGGNDGDWAFYNLIVRQAASGELIVDGSITAAAIAAGAITADMITSGTLNAADVNIVNLNADNITTGTLSATQVIFPDGSSLSTASRVVMATAYSTSTVTTTSSGAYTSIPGLGWSTTTSYTTDTYNITALILMDTPASDLGNAITLALVVDGNIVQPASTIGFTWSAPTYLAMPFVASITGLSPGSHTLQMYVSYPWSTGTGAVIEQGCYATCQRIY